MLTSTYVLINQALLNVWMLGHSYITGKNMADQLAKQGIINHFYGSDLSLGIFKA